MTTKTDTPILTGVFSVRFRRYRSYAWGQDIRADRVPLAWARAVLCEYFDTPGFVAQVVNIDTMRVIDEVRGQTHTTKKATT